METILEKLKAPAFFETEDEPALWWALVDHMKMDIGDYRYAVCVQTGHVKRFSIDTLVKNVNLKILKV